LNGAILRLVAAAFLILPFLLGGCRSGSNSSTNIDDLPPSAAAWGYTLGGGDYMLAKAEILRPAGDHAIQVICKRLEKSMQIRVWAPGWQNGPLAGAAETRRLALGFDGAAPVRQIWSSDANGFTLGRRDPGFDDVVRRLVTHRTVTVVTSGGALPETREELPLAVAPRAIKRVFADCEREWVLP
jgi:hypothetical protein